LNDKRNIEAISRERNLKVSTVINVTTLSWWSDILFSEQNCWCNSSSL